MVFCLTSCRSSTFASPPTQPSRPIQSQGQAPNSADHDEDHLVSYPVLYLAPTLLRNLKGDSAPTIVSGHCDEMAVLAGFAGQSP
jgi:hypothetical protein